MDDVDIKPDSNLRLLKVFQTSEEATEICTILEENKIAYSLTDSQPPLLLTTDTSRFKWWLLVPDDELESAMGLIESSSQNNDLGEEKETYYLFDFSNEELIQVLENFDEWGDEDYQLAVKILSERGIIFSEKKLEEFKSKRIDFLSQPEAGNMSWIVFGWVMALLGGVFGLIIGWHFKSLKESSAQWRKSALL